MAVLIYMMLCALFLSFVEAKSKYIDKDDDRPYEFGFSIENYQHRHEKKDEKGIIMGEFGFVTADGIYHVTVYATDENGDFKILSMKNVRVGPSPYGTTKTPSKSSTSTMSSIYPTVADSTPKIQQKLTSPEVATPKFQQKLTSPEVATPKPQQKQASTEVTTSKTSPVAACSHCKIPEPVTFKYNNSVNLGANNVPGLRNNSPSPAKLGRPYSNGLGDKTQTIDSPETQMNPALQDIKQQPSGNPQSPSVNLGSALKNQGLNLRYPSSPGNYPQNQISNPAKPGQPHSNGLGDKTQKTDSPETQMNSALQGINQQSGGNPQSPSVNLESPLQNQGLNLGYPNSPGNYPQNQRSNPAKPILDPVSSSSYPQKPVLTSAIMKTLTDAYPIPESGQKPGLPEGLSAQDMLGLLYRFNYTVGFHGHQEVGYGNGDKEGKYFVNNRDGVGTKVEYLANEFGYQPNITLYDLKEEDTPKEETEKNYGLKGYEFKWFNQIEN